MILEYKTIITSVKKNKEGNKVKVEVLALNKDRCPAWMSFNTSDSFYWSEDLSLFERLKDSFGNMYKGYYEPVPGTYYLKLLKLEDKSGNVIFGN